LHTSGRYLLTPALKHLIKFAELINGKRIYRFASHPRFSYWAFNMIQRRRTLQQTGIFLKQNPGEAHLTIEELHEMAENNSSAAFMSKCPTFFFTFSSADMHWPELHNLFATNSDKAINCTSEQRRQNCINNPHVVDCFFTQRLESFIKCWLYDTLDAEWHWFRYEYQGRGNIHCHGTAKLKNDPGLCQLTKIALKGFLAQKCKEETDVDDTSQLDHDIETGNKAAQTVCQYVDWLSSIHSGGSNTAVASMSIGVLFVPQDLMVDGAPCMYGGY
jgi:hypothetical protein